MGLGRTSGLQDLALLLGAIRERQGDDLVEFRDVDLDGLVSIPSGGKSSDAYRTFSRMTSGPLTPRTVL